MFYMFFWGVTSVHALSIILLQALLENGILLVLMHRVVLERWEVLEITAFKELGVKGTYFGDSPLWGIMIAKMQNIPRSMALLGVFM
jgi:hypothetical protein